MVIKPLFRFLEMPAWASAAETRDGSQKFKSNFGAYSQASLIPSTNGNRLGVRSSKNMNKSMQYIDIIQYLVEPGGIEPPSISPTLQDLRT
jgi:hypothetical protein